VPWVWEFYLLLALSILTAKGAGDGGKSTTSLLRDLHWRGEAGAGIIMEHDML
jgi:hypothetical protein